MFTKNFAKIILIPLIILLTACGSSSAATTQPIAQSGGRNSSITENASSQASAPAGNNIVPATAAVPVGNNITSTTVETTSPIQTSLTYPIVDTNQTFCYDNSSSISCPSEGQAFYGQDGQYVSNAASCTDNGDGTVTDNVTEPP